jgi:hypothetical protein
VNLYRLVRGPLRRLGREHLRHARLATEGTIVVLEPGGLQDHVPCQLDLHSHVRQLELYGLELGDRPAELPALDLRQDVIAPAVLQRQPVNERLRDGLDGE